MATRLLAVLRRGQAGRSGLGRRDVQSRHQLERSLRCWREQADAAQDGVPRDRAGSRGEARDIYIA